MAHDSKFSGEKRETAPENDDSLVWDVLLQLQQMPLTVVLQIRQKYILGALPLLPEEKDANFYQFQTCFPSSFHHTKIRKKKTAKTSLNHFAAKVFPSLCEIRKRCRKKGKYMPNVAERTKSLKFQM